MMAAMRSLASVIALVLLVLTPACADRTALRLVIRSDLAVPLEMDSLLIQMRSSTGATAPPRGVELVGTAFPQTLVVRPEASGMSGTVTFTVIGLRAGTIVIQRVVSAAFRSGQIVDVEVDLNSDCLGVECGEGIDCVRGLCQGAQPDAGMPDAAVVADAGEDAGVPIDAFSVVDAYSALDAFSAGDAPSPRDAFAVDAFVPGADAYRVPDAFVPLDAFVIPDAYVLPDAYRIPDAYVPPDTGIGCTGVGCVGIVLISEFSHVGPVGGLDEIVELYNTSSRTADIGGTQIFYTSASGGTRSGRATIPAGTRMLPHSYLLLSGSQYAGPPASDVIAWTMGASDTGGSWSLELSGTVLDRVCWGTAVAAICEGTGLVAPPPVAGSYERKASATSTATSMSAGGADALAGNAYDTGNNAEDFVLRPARDPQSSTSPIEP